MEQYIRRGKSSALYGSLPVSAGINLTVAASLLFVFRTSDPYRSIILSTVLVWITNLFRMLIYLIQKKTNRKDRETGMIWKGLFISGTILSAAAWGSSTLLIFPSATPTHQFFLALILTGLASGGITSLSAFFFMAFTYVQLMLLPLLFSFLISSFPLPLEMAALVFLFDGFICYASYKLSRHGETNLSLEYSYITAREKLKLSEQRYEAIFKEAPVGIFYYDKDMILKECNTGFSDIPKTPVSRLKGLYLPSLPDKRILPTLKKILSNQNGFYEGPYRSAVSKIDLWATLRTSPVTDAKGRVTGGVGIVQDITEQKKIQQEIHHQAYHDILTGLSNRQLLMDRLTQTLKRARRHDHMGALLFLDLDKFKLVNDTMGHQTGDELLKEVGRRLSAVLRNVDTVSRVGGDEFVILLPELINDREAAANQARIVAEKIHTVLADPIVIEGHNIHTSTSIGIIIFDGEEESPDLVLKYADTAMYNAKDQGRNRTSFYHSEMDEIMQRQLLLEIDLRKALELDELEMYFQPIVSIGENRIVGAEALLRWNHPERGFISPEEIIRTAENTGQILPLGKWILEKALSLYAGWIAGDSIRLDYISINISIRQVLQENFVEETLAAIRRAGISPERIVLEVTESVLITEFDNTVLKIKALRETGVQFALDDFGTGYSSLSYLKKLPLDKLKIDRTFTENLLSDRDDFALVETIMSIAEHFDLPVISEGVENAEQMDLLRKMGCPLYQGYYCSRPLPPEQFLSFTGGYPSG